MASLKQIAKKALWTTFPLSIRKHLAIWLDRQMWLSDSHWLAREIIRDWNKNDPNAYHRFLWSNHLGYAETYEIAMRFGAENINETRHMLLSDLKEFLSSKGIELNKDVNSIFDVGCSLGYFLHYLETEICPAATFIEGIDIDEYAIRTGMTYLKRKGSNIRLYCGDIVNLESMMGDNRYDVIFCLGVLMYLTENKAYHALKDMLNYADKLVAISGLAHPLIDNSKLSRSEVRPNDGAWIHNFDAMVKKAGGTVVYRRWEGDRMVDGNTIYFIFCCRDTSYSKVS